MRTFPTQPLFKSHPILACAGVCLALAVLLTATAQADPIKIDTFDVPADSELFQSYDLITTPPVHLQQKASSLLQATDPAAPALRTVLGGTRDVLVTNTTYKNKPSDAQAYSGEIGDGHFQLNSGNQSRVTAVLQYDGSLTGDTPTALYNSHGLAVDLTDHLSAKPNDYIDIVFGWSRAMKMKVIVDSPVGQATRTVDVPFSEVPIVVPVMFSQFEGYKADPSQNPLAQADSLTFELNFDDATSDKPEQNVVFELRSIQAVPEPSTIAMVGAGVLVLAGQVIWRRRRKAAA